MTPRMTRILKLMKFLNRDAEMTSPNVIVESYEERRDTATLEIHVESEACTLVSWMESGHNGDFYDRKDRMLHGAEKNNKLMEAEAMLFERAKRQVVETEQREKQQKEQDRLNTATRLAVFGDDLGL